MEEDKVTKILKELKVSITESEILDRLLDRLRWPKTYSLYDMPSVEAINEDGSKHQSFFNDDNYLNSMNCIQCYEEGYTLILSNVGGLCKDLWLIQEILSDNFKRFIDCNLYFGNGKKSVSFKKHRHEYPVIVKNLYGSSKWIINDKEIVLNDQNAIWFDKETDHQVIEINEPKASLTCNIV